MKILTREEIVEGMGNLQRSRCHELMKSVKTEHTFEQIFVGQCPSHVEELCNVILDLPPHYPTTSNNLIHKVYYDSAIMFLGSFPMHVCQWTEIKFYGYFMHSMVIEELQFLCKARGVVDWQFWSISKGACHDFFGLTHKYICRHATSKVIGNGLLESFKSMRDNALRPFLDFIHSAECTLPCQTIRTSSNVCDAYIPQYLDHQKAQRDGSGGALEALRDDNGGALAPAPTCSFISKAVSTHPAGRRNRIQGSMSEEDGVPRMNYWEGAPDAFQAIHTFADLRDLLRSPFLDNEGRMHMKMVDYTILLNHLMTAERMFWAFHE